MTSLAKSGGCLCGSVIYRVSGPLRPVIYCHCAQCRKSSGHFVAATQCATADLVITGETLHWFTSSDKARRGFCAQCGSGLFWQPFGEEVTSIWAGTLDDSSDLKEGGQIHCADSVLYYELPDVPILD